MSCFLLVEQRENRETPRSVRTVLPTARPLPHALRVDRHPPHEYREQRRQSGERHRAGDEPLRFFHLLLSYTTVFAWQCQCPQGDQSRTTSALI